MSSFRSVSIFICNKVYCVCLTVWKYKGLIEKLFLNVILLCITRSNPTNGSLNVQCFLISSYVFEFSLFRSLNTIACFITATILEWNAQFLSNTVVTYAKLYPSTPMLSFSYFNTVASFGSSTGAAKAHATIVANTMIIFILDFFFFLFLLSKITHNTRLDRLELENWMMTS